MKRKRYSDQQIAFALRQAENGATVGIGLSQAEGVESDAWVRAECLNARWFLSRADARERIEAWRIDYNTERSRSAPDDLTPRAFALGKLKPPERSLDCRDQSLGKTTVITPLRQKS